MAEASNLMAEASKYKGASADLQVQQQLAKHKPDWVKLGMHQAKADLLKLVELRAPAAKTKAILQGSRQTIEACLEALAVPELRSVQWMITVLHDLLREDASCYNIFEDALKANVNVCKVFTAVIDKNAGDVYVCKNAAWILTSVMGFLSRFFSESEVKTVADKITASPSTYSELGVLESVTNLLKSDTFRAMLWKEASVRSLLMQNIGQQGGGLKNLEAEVLYKVIFAIWLLSLDANIIEELNQLGVPKKIKEVIASRKVEKVVRIALIALKALLTNKQACEDVVEAGAYDAVVNLEFEKWRDAELYDEIRDMGAQIANHVHDMSNFDRYERELQTGQLKWGFIHTTKFWGENVMKFENNDYRAVTTLVGCLHSDDHETLAVACHDLGEFVTLHPFGKKKAAQLNIKSRVMELMQLSGDSDKTREVRREALLCCQKIMLNKWQDIDKAKAAN